MVMSVLWSGDEDLDLHQITERANKKFGKSWKIQTVATFLTRLEKKKYISIYRIGRFSHYHPEVSRDEYRKIVLDEVAARLFEGDCKAVVKFARKLVKK